ncbi:hypothetical protein ABT390_34850 [Streptomyces aurantiacus]|uniref:hypothetical protein n=1 Tax=Streptomyces aurantiacus TaxID=47760 RepID=UPI00040F75F4|nr:hypothetical protein [Streptomyces aurantiacus]
MPSGNWLPTGLLTGTAVLALAGCSSLAGRESAATAVAEHFQRSHLRPQAACHDLAPATREELELDAESACPDALRDLGLPVARRVTGVDVYGRQARVVLDRDTLFLASVDGDWKITAAGCTPPDTAERPYDCLLKGG